jgi:glycosyltransferase involved in cell wall biosynthesis
MKILIVTNYLPPKIGGIERISHELASALNRLNGIEVTVASSKWPTKFIEAEWEELNYPYEIVYFPSVTIFRRLPIPKFYQKHFWRKVKDLNTNFDLVFYQSHLFILNWIIAFNLRKVNRRIWMNQGCNYVPMNNRLGSLISFIYERLGMIIMKHICNEFIGQSINTANWISSKVGLPFDVLPNATTLENLDNEFFKSDMKVRTNVLFVGRLVEGKGLLECVSAISQANKILVKNQDYKLFNLTIVGSGPLVNQIYSRDWNVDICFRGELSHSQVIRAMCQSDILIQAYAQPEGFTSVTLEGLATGLIVVTTPLSGDANLTECINYIFGSLVELPELIIKARELKSTRSELLDSGRRFIEAGLTWNVIAQRLINRDYSKV